MLLALVTLFGLGLYHGVGPDHCLAIGALSARGGMRHALRVSVQFGVSHSLVLAFCALGTTALGMAIPEGWESALEVLGGASLLALGLWTVFSANALIPHQHGAETHTHDLADTTSHTHGGRSRNGGRLAAVVGALFSLSGVRGLLLLLPLVLRQRTGTALFGVASFGLGVVCAMIAFGWLTQRVFARATAVERGLRLSVGVASVVLGSYWIFDHLG